MYHDVVPAGQWDASGFPGPWAGHYKLEAGAFRQHLDHLAASTAAASVTTSLATQQAAAHWPVLLTFDDGGVSAYDRIADALERHNWRGYFFMTSDWIGRPGFLDERQLRDLHARGHVIGSHSRSHPTRMASCSRSEILDEWRDSLVRLSDLLSAGIDTASVPGGYYSSAVGEAANDAGIRVLFTSEPTVKAHRVGGCLVVGRFAITRSMSPDISARLARGDVAPRAWQSSAWRLKKVAKRVGGRAYLAVGRLLRSGSPEESSR
jgi:peptidoglycan/xylan/chitin deacetylase (PgdA/CDA1 family)